MNILKIVYYIMQMFGWEGKCKLPMLPSPKVFNLKKITFLTSEKESLENQKVAATDDYFNGMKDKMALMPAESQTDLFDSRLLNLGALILVVLCLTCLLKMRRRRKAEPKYRSIQQRVREDIFLDFPSDEEDEFVDSKSDEENDSRPPPPKPRYGSWDSSVNREYVLYCRFLSDEECARAPDVP